MLRVTQHTAYTRARKSSQATQQNAFGTLSFVPLVAWGLICENSKIHTASASKKRQIWPPNSLHVDYSLAENQSGKRCRYLDSDLGEGAWDTLSWNPGIEEKRGNPQQRLHLSFHPSPGIFLLSSIISISVFNFLSSRVRNKLWPPVIPLTIQVLHPAKNVTTRFPKRKIRSTPIDTSRSN